MTYPITSSSSSFALNPMYIYRSCSSMKLSGGLLSHDTRRWGCQALRPRPLILPCLQKKKGFRHTRVGTRAAKANTDEDEKYEYVIGELGKVYSGGRPASWLAPEDYPKNNPAGPAVGASADNPARAKGVVIFMHGFSQGPPAYYRLLKQLTDLGLLVIAPETAASASLEGLQGAMASNALHFYSKIVTNTLTGIDVPRKARDNIALLGHSAGAGVATYVAAQAAEKHPPGFKAAMFLAPQTSLLVSQYKPKTVMADQQWPAHILLACQWGLKDLLAPPGNAEELNRLLQIDVFEQTSYAKGTHVGFQDKLLLPVGFGLPVWFLTATGMPLAQAVLWLRDQWDKWDWPKRGGGGGVEYMGGPVMGGADMGAAGVGQLWGLSQNAWDSAEGLLGELASARLPAPQDTALWLLSNMAQSLCPWFILKSNLDGLGDAQKVYETTKQALLAQSLSLIVLTSALTYAAVGCVLHSFEETAWRTWLAAAVAVFGGVIPATGLFFTLLDGYVQEEQRPQCRETIARFMQRCLFPPPL